MNDASKTSSEAEILDRLKSVRKTAPVGTIWHHLKSGHLYKVTDYVVDESDLSVRVVYARVGSDTPIPWGRTAENFMDGLS